MNAPVFQPRSDRFETRVRDSFARQALMATAGAQLTRVLPGEVEIGLSFNANFGQQHGFLHGGMVAALLDSACSYAGYSLMDDESTVLTAEYKVNFLAPVGGVFYRAVGRVIKPGRTLIVTEGRGYAVAEDGSEKLAATMSATIMAVRGRDLPD